MPENGDRKGSIDQELDLEPGHTYRDRPVGAGADRLWAPWRIVYFTEPRPDECVFCTLPADQKSPVEETLILCRFDSTYVVMNKYPYNTGHLMVVPYEHTDNIQDLAPAVHAEMFEAAALCMDVIREALNAQGFNIGLNLGKAAGAGILEHLHLHVVPRWIGDTNFMPVLMDTKVLSEDLAGTYKRLRPGFDRRATQR